MQSDNDSGGENGVNDLDRQLNELAASLGVRWSDEPEHAPVESSTRDRILASDVGQKMVALSTICHGRGWYIRWYLKNNSVDGQVIVVMSRYPFEAVPGQGYRPTGRAFTVSLDNDFVRRQRENTLGAGIISMLEGFE